MFSSNWKKVVFYIIGINISALFLFGVMSLNSEILHSKQNSGSSIKRALEEGAAPTNSKGGQSAPSESSQEHDSGHGDGIHISEGGWITMFSIMALFLGAVLREVKKKTNIPYTPMVLSMGLLIGYFAEHIIHISDSVRFVNSIDPHTMLMIFIPTLVFESSYNSNGYTFSKSKWQILLMAGPGVLLTALSVAFGLLYIFRYDGELSLSECLVIGSIVSVTDPVAVVALLKELGTSIKFNTLLEGESLLNDGTAYVFFLISAEVVKSGKFDIVQSIIMFFRLSCGGPLLGLLTGWLSVAWLKHILKDNLLIVQIVAVAIYFMFFVAENFLKVSGILALVTLGLYLGTNAKMHFSHESDHSVHTVWSFITYCLETLIFFITGTYIGEQLRNRDEYSFRGSDIWKVILFYFFLGLVRYIVMLLQYPVLNRIGYRITLTSAFILSWAGLRGAIALSLALLVILDDVFSKRFKDLCLLYVVTMIVMTVLLNGLSIKFLMKKTGFLKEDLTKKKMFDSVVKQVIFNTLDRENSLKESNYLTMADWDSVDKLAGVSYMIEKYKRRKEREEKEKEENRNRGKKSEKRKEEGEGKTEGKDKENEKERVSLVDGGSGRRNLINKEKPKIIINEKSVDFLKSRSGSKNEVGIKDYLSPMPQRSSSKAFVMDFNKEIHSAGLVSRQNGKKGKSFNNFKRKFCWFVGGGFGARLEGLAGNSGKRHSGNSFPRLRKRRGGRRGRR